MSKLTNEQEIYKQAIYDSLTERRKRFIDRIGYAKWDPFQQPKDPIEWRVDVTKRTAQQLVREFMQECKPDDYSNAYGQGVLDMCLGLVNGDAKCQGMFEFVLWYSELLKKENASLLDL